MVKPIYGNGAESNQLGKINVKRVFSIELNGDNILIPSYLIENLLAPGSYQSILFEKHRFDQDGKPIIVDFADYSFKFYEDSIEIKCDKIFVNNQAIKNYVRIPKERINKMNEELDGTSS